MFENKLYNVTVNGQKYEVHASRIIASWSNVSKTPASRNFKFEDWLETLLLSEEDRKEIIQFADNGKLELEAAVSSFIS